MTGLFDVSIENILRPYVQELPRYTVHNGSIVPKISILFPRGTVRSSNVVVENTSGGVVFTSEFI
jgi:hypothetical protein